MIVKVLEAQTFSTFEVMKVNLFWFDELFEIPNSPFPLYPILFFIFLFKIKKKNYFYF